MRLFLICINLSFLFISSCTNEESISEQRVLKKDPEKVRVDIQPLGKIDEETIKLTQQAIQSFYGFKVEILNWKDMDERAFTEIRSPRYRADTMIKILKNQKSAKTDFILGITDKDISVTKKNADGSTKEPQSKYIDFGIFGLGYRPGPSCIVSVYRIKKPTTKFRDRFTKIVLHELGHNLGLKHCSDKRCLMTDAAESIKTIDNANLDLCISCKKKIGLIK